MYDPQLSAIISDATSRLNAEMVQAAPFMAGRVSAWMRQLAGTAQPEAYFKHPLAFPSLLLPWWAEQTVSDKTDLSLQGNLVYSTINGYYYIRLIDNLMDDHATTELQLLPAISFFHTQFQLAYQRHFPQDHSFWDFFCRVWFHSAEVALSDANMSDIDEAHFTQISAQKTCAAKIPLAAVCHHHDRPDLIEPWSRFIDLFGCWHQFTNDLFDWHNDHQRQTATYFLSEAKRRCRAKEQLTGWLAREGFTWGIDKSHQWMSALHASAGNLNSPHLMAYLETRQAMLLQQQEKLTKGLQSLAKLAAIERP